MPPPTLTAYFSIFLSPGVVFRVHNIFVLVSEINCTIIDVDVAMPER